jgi:hypothetical protein
MTTDNAEEERTQRKTRLYLSRRYDGLVGQTLQLRELRSSRAQLQPCRRARRSKRRDSMSTGLQLASLLTAGRFLICLSPSAPLLARVDSSDRIRVEHEHRVQEHGVWVQRPICLSREAVDASFTTIYGLSLSTLTLGQRPVEKTYSHGVSSDGNQSGDSQIAVGASKQRWSGSGIPMELVRPHIDDTA